MKFVRAVCSVPFPSHHVNFSCPCFLNGVGHQPSLPLNTLIVVKTSSLESQESPGSFTLILKDLEQSEEL